MSLRGAQRRSNLDRSRSWPAQAARRDCFGTLASLAPLAMTREPLQGPASLCHCEVLSEAKGRGNPAVPDRAVTPFRHCRKRNGTRWSTRGPSEGSYARYSAGAATAAFKRSLEWPKRLFPDMEWGMVPLSVSSPAPWPTLPRRFRTSVPENPNRRHLCRARRRGPADRGKIHDVIHLSNNGEGR